MDIKEFRSVISKKYDELNNISPEYLSEAGKAAKEAYRVTLWHMEFHNTLESLRDDEEFNKLVEVTGSHPEYYRVLRMLMRSVVIWVWEDRE